MANLDLWHWEEHAPAIGQNRSLPDAERFTLRVKSGIARAELDAFFRAPGKTLDELEASLKGLVEMGRNPPSIGGREVKTLRDLLELALEQSGGGLLKEMVGAVAHFNSYRGSRSFFFEPPAGGPSGTEATGGGSGGATQH